MSMIHRRLFAPTLFMALIAASASVTAQAGASSRQVGSAKRAPSAPSSVVFIDSPSSESPEARKKRLRKECEGRPNAGACLGMTR
jgi:hypothetical protein